MDDEGKTEEKEATWEVNADSLRAFPLIPISLSSLTDSALICRKIHQNCQFGNQGEQLCIDCAFLNEKQFGSIQETEFLKHCRIIRGFVEQTASELYSYHVASILLTSSAHVIDCDQRGRSFLRTGGLLSILHNKLRCNEQSQNTKVNKAIQETAKSGRSAVLLLSPLNSPLLRYSLVFIRLAQRIQSSESKTVNPSGSVLCIVAPLDRRRFATVLQLMNLFGLSGAEARLARAICHGHSLQEYATDQGLKLPTVKTQLRSVFAKTRTERQSSLIRLLSGIPVVREERDKVSE